MTSRIIAAALASIMLAGTAASAGGDRRDRRDTCPPPRTQHNDRRHNDHYRNHNDRHYSRRHNTRYYGRSHDRDGFGVHFGDGFTFSIGTGSRHSSRYGSYRSRHDSHWPYGSYSRSYRHSLPTYNHSTRRSLVYVDRPVVREIVREVPVYRDVPHDPYAKYRIGWNALAQSDLYAAREFFTDKATYRPNDPTPKAGLALARAGAGHDDQAEWAMRRAVRAGLKQARDQMPMYDIERVLSRIELRYEERAYAYHDRWFMVAAARYLKGDNEGASVAAEKALSYDQHDNDARRLYDLAQYSK